jgi:hypothetical protein
MRKATRSVGHQPGPTLEGGQEFEARLRERQSNLHQRLVRDILDTGAVAKDIDFPNLCGSILCLEGDEIPPECRILRLERLQVAARDEETLLLQFQCSEGAIGIRHLGVLYPVSFVHSSFLYLTCAVTVPLDAFPYFGTFAPVIATT